MIFVLRRAGEATKNVVQLFLKSQLWCERPRDTLRHSDARSSREDWASITRCNSSSSGDNCESGLKNYPGSKISVVEQSVLGYVNMKRLAVIERADFFFTTIECNLPPRRFFHVKRKNNKRGTRERTSSRWRNTVLPKRQQANNNKNTCTSHYAPCIKHISMASSSRVTGKNEAVVVVSNCGGHYFRPLDFAPLEPAPRAPSSSP